MATPHFFPLLHFDNSSTRELPLDPETRNFRRQVTDACSSLVRPLHVSAPELVAYSAAMAAELGLSQQDCESDIFLQIFSGNELLPGMEPHAACYGGHQFGNWAGQLGDGRAINLGEVLTKENKRLMLQLKGAGPTPYSRNADGLAVLRSSIREFICSEAMHYLGIPTTRALSLIQTGDPVERDMFYDGHPQEEPGALVCRVAPTFIRFGNFEIFAARDEIEVLKQLADYTIRYCFPHLDTKEAQNANKYIALFHEVSQKTAALMAEWLRVGFVHGVMNTDNMSIMGLTIDYGPYGWLEPYDPVWTPNTTDRGHRYCYGRQAQIAHWNLAKLANALYPLVGKTEPFEEILREFTQVFDSKWQKMMAAKLGFKKFNSTLDQPLVERLLRLLTEVETDMTIFYRSLAQVSEMLTHKKKTPEECLPAIESAWYNLNEINKEYRTALCAWLADYAKRLQLEPMAKEERAQRMNKANPKYIFRNYLAQEAVDQAEHGNYSLIHTLIELLHSPYDEQPAFERFAAKRPEWAKNKPGCSMLSCSS